MLGLIGGGLAGTVVASNIASLVDVIPGVGSVAIWGGSLAISIGLYVLAFQLLTDVDLPWKDILPGAIFGGTGWWALQTFGSVLIVRQQESAGQAYGDFASIIALLVFLFLAAQISILGAEISVVKARHLWPRSIQKGSLTEADVRAFELLARSTRQDERYDVTLTTKVDPDADPLAPGRRRRLIPSSDPGAPSGSRPASVCDSTSDMARYTVSIRTDRSPEDAFDYVADLRNFAEWDPGVRQLRAPRGRRSPGSMPCSGCG